QGVLPYPGLEGAMGTAEAAPPRVTDLRGDVKICKKVDGKLECRTAENGLELKEGESIQTRDGAAELSFDDGSKAWIRENTLFTPTKMEGNILTQGHLLKGQIRAMFNRLTCRREMGGCNIQTPEAVAAVRGTEFDIRIDDANNTHLAPHDGIVELKAVAKNIDRKKLKRWWNGRLSEEEPEELPYGIFAVVLSVEGKVGHKQADGGWEHVETGTEVSADDRLETGTDSHVELALKEGYVALVGPRSRFEARTDEYEKAIYGLWRGKMYVTRRGDTTLKPDMPPVFIGPAAHCKVDADEFEFSVAESNLADYMVYQGAIEVTAEKERIEWDKVDRWWH
ncbi:FecR domain-containing protein, partial [Elusimicrobiota bacterium]